MTNTTAQTSPETEGDDGTFTAVIIKRAGVLIDTADKSSRWEMEARAVLMSAVHLLRGLAPRSQQSIKTEPDAVQCARCNGDQFVSGAWPDMPDEPCPVCNSGAPSGAERVRLAALSDTSTDGHTRFCAIHTVGDCTCSLSPPERQP
jgi:hypothetical protein